MRNLDAMHLRGLTLALVTAILAVIGPGFSYSRQAEVLKAGSRPETQHTFQALIALKGTAPLSTPITEDIRETQRQQIIRFFLKQIAATPAKRDALWQPDFSTLSAYNASIQMHRKHLREILGLIQPTAGAPQSRTLQESATLRVSEITIPIEKGLEARALLFLPRSNAPIASVIAIPSARETPEQFAGIAEGATPARWLTALLERQIAVAVPFMTERRGDHPICKQAGGQDERRILWRAGFIIGRTLVGIEVQHVLALREFLASQSGFDSKQIAVMGEGQGGMTALYAGAADESLAAVASLSYFQQRENCWQEPVDRVLYGQLNEFGDAEVAALVAPRPLFIATTTGSEIPSAGVGAELARARRFYAGLHQSSNLADLGRSEDVLDSAALRLASVLGTSQKSNTPELTFRASPQQIAKGRDHNFEALFQYLRDLGTASSKVRTNYWQLNSTPPRDRAQKIQQLRKELGDLVGTIPTDHVPLRPRSSLIGETDKFLAYDVLLDVAPGVEAYGQLLVPRTVAGHVSRRLPAVICQHGFDGAPKYVSGVGTGLASNDHFYHRFGQRLAERGYVVFAPYLSVPMVHTQPSVVYRADLVNPLVRLAACLGVMRTSIELTKLHRIVDFLQSLPFVQADRIGYYGLSYGGYSAIWMPPLEPRLSLTVISAHFNDWQTMLTDTERFGASYWTLPDEDFYSWNELNRFDHTQLIAAMWPRPVCIEYGSEDQVTTPEWHERAWKEVKAFADSWGMEDKIVDDKFNGPHSIHGIRTFSFLDRWLRPELSAGRDYGCRDDDYCDESVAPGFHGYIRDSKDSLPYIARALDSNENSVIRGSFYVSNVASVFTGMAFKVARNGNPGALIVKFGSSEGSDDLGEAIIDPREVYPREDFWYEAVLKKAVRLDPTKLYFFEIRSTSGQAPNDLYTIFGPTPLGGEDFPSNFGLSFRTLTTSDQ